MIFQRIEFARVSAYKCDNDVLLVVLV